MAFGNHCAKIEIVALVGSRPDIDALIDQLIALIHDNQGLASGFDGTVLDGTFSQQFTAQIDFAVGRFRENGHRCGLITGRWLFGKSRRSTERKGYSAKSEQFRDEFHL